MAGEKKRQFGNVRKLARRVGGPRWQGRGGYRRSCGTDYGRWVTGNAKGILADAGRLLASGHGGSSVLGELRTLASTRLSA